MLILASLLIAAPPTSLIENGNFRHPWAEKWIGSQKGRATLDVRQSQADDHGASLTITTQEQANPWDSQLGQTVQKPIARGDVIYFQAWMRSPTRNKVFFIFEETDPPNSKSISESATLVPEWKEYKFAAKAIQGYVPGKSQAKFFFGQSTGTIEISDVRVENHGQIDPKSLSQTRDFWGGQAHDDSWKAAAFARIEKIRKGDFTIRVVDGSGKPVANAAVKVNQQRHAFRFGTAAAASRILGNSPDDIKYKDILAKNFNTVVFENDLKWMENSDRLAQAKAAMPWLKEHGFEVRGHNLVWGSFRWLPKRIEPMTVDETWSAIQDHVKEYVNGVKGDVYVWDVVNEAVSETGLWDKIGWNRFADTYKLAHSLDSKVELAYNDYNISNTSQVGFKHQADAIARAQYLKDHGAPVNVFGDQGHMGTPFTPIPKVMKAWDNIDKLGLPIEITEFDLNVDDDSSHSAYATDVLIAAFSHPSIQSFVMWGFWEGSHWLPKGAMYRRDWSARPAADQWHDWIYNKWWTRANLKSGRDGRTTSRGFYGDYSVEVTAGNKVVKKSFRLEPNSKHEIVIKI